MHFDFSAVTKKKKSNAKQVKTNLYNIIKKNIYCVASIDLEGKYYALDIETNERYIITSRSYSAKTTTYYAQELIDGKRLKIIELKRKNNNTMPDLYLPFAPGVGLLGDLVKSNISENNILFDLKKTFDMPRDNELSHNELINFKNNYEEIRKKIIERYAKSSI